MQFNSYLLNSLHTLNLKNYMHYDILLQITNFETNVSFELVRINPYQMYL